MSEKAPFVYKKLEWDNQGNVVMDYDETYTYLDKEYIRFLRHLDHDEEYIWERNEAKRVRVEKKLAEEEAEKQRKKEADEKRQAFIDAHPDEPLASYLYTLTHYFQYAPSTIKRKMREERKRVAAVAFRKEERRQRMAWIVNGVEPTLGK